MSKLLKTMIKNKINRTILFIKEQIIIFFKHSTYYNISYAFYSFVWWVCFYIKIPYSYQISKRCILKKTIFWDRRIKERYNDILENVLTERKEQVSENYKHIWVFWAQGINQMPPLIKACYTQLTHFNKNTTLVTLDNLHQYVHFKDDLLERVKNGEIKWANFSDIIRNSLLASYGGLWLDATVWVSGEVPFEKISKSSYWTAYGIDNNLKQRTAFWSSLEWNWSSSVLFSRDKEFILFSFLSKMLNAIAEREKIWPDYVIQDCLIYYAYRHFPEIRKNINVNNLPSYKRLSLAKLMDKEFCMRTYQELIKTDFVYKLSFRTPWIKRASNDKQTFYGRILSGIIEPICNYNHEN